MVGDRVVGLQKVINSLRLNANEFETSLSQKVSPDELNFKILLRNFRILLWGTFVKKEMLNQKGFSLVELIVVVAIVGILSSMVVPLYGKMALRARQAEAKTQLAALFTAEKAFYAEYLRYHSVFAAVGYAPEGQVRYNVGFGSYGVVAGTGDGYRTVLSSVATNTVNYCTGPGGLGSSTACRVLMGEDGYRPPPIPVALTTTATDFTAGAYIYLPPKLAVNKIDVRAPSYASAVSAVGVFGQVALMSYKSFAVGTWIEPVDTPIEPLPPAGEERVIPADSWTMNSKGVLSQGGPAVTCAAVTNSSRSVDVPGMNHTLPVLPPVAPCSSEPRLRGPDSGAM